MILVRMIFRVKWGKADEVVKAMKESAPAMAPETGHHWRLLTDLGGEMFTVVLEAEMASLAEWEQFRAQLFRDPRFQESQQRTVELIESGRQEFYTVAAQG